MADSTLDLDKWERRLDESKQQEKQQPLASYFYENLQSQISILRESLQPHQDISAQYSLHGEVIRVTELGWANPNMIILHGLDSQGQTTVVCVHLAAAEVILKVVSIKKAVERRPIGFLGELQAPPGNP